MIYHSYINKYNYDDKNKNKNLLEITDKSLHDYNLINIREDYHHLTTYHEENIKFMNKLYKKLMEINDLKNDINNIDIINNKIANNMGLW